MVFALEMLGGTHRSSSSPTPTWTPRCEGAMIAKMRNGGEACTAANRF